MKQLKNTSKIVFFPTQKWSKRSYTQQIAPSAPLLDEIADKIKTHPNHPCLEKSVFIGVQHILASTATLFDALIKLGANPKNMFFSGNGYSTSPVVTENIREKEIHLMATKYPCEPGEYQAASITSRLEEDGKTINSPSRHVLDPYLQRYVFQHWLKEQRFNEDSDDMVENFNDVAWIKNNSGSNDHPNSFLMVSFNHLDKKPLELQQESSITTYNQL